MRFTPALLSFAATVAAHGDHGHDQDPLNGPHEGLWYNTLPGDGGKQVRIDSSKRRRTTLTYVTAGRFHLLRHIHIRPPSIPPMSL